uniref:Uncharacterized protein n=1 Tax=Ananas comosus var. bracteatus TaxID=296719 RepID=A0A6V7QUM2_ANACO
MGLPFSGHRKARGERGETRSRQENGGRGEGVGLGGAGPRRPRDPCVRGGCVDVAPRGPPPLPLRARGRPAPLRHHAVPGRRLPRLHRPVLLLRLACAELLSDLDRSAAAVARFGSRCGDDSPLVRDFALVYAALKTGSADLDRFGLRLTGSRVQKKFAKMERFVRATAKLSEEMEALDELEAAERKMAQRWADSAGRCRC